MEEGREFQPSTSSSAEKSDSENSSDQSQGLLSDDSRFQNTDLPRMPIVYPFLAPGLITPQYDQEQMNGGPGLYAVSANPLMHAFAGYQTPALAPFTYNLHTQPSSTGNNGAGDTQVRDGEQQQAGLGPQRRVVIRRFQIAFQIDLFLILKLMAVIFLFNHDGSKQRLALLVFLAVIVYLYQTGALTPLLRWLSQGMQQAPAVAPRPRMAAVRPENLGAIGNENEAGEGNQPNDGARDNEPEGEAPAGEARNRWMAVVKEIRMFVFGFITSLLPDFHHVD